MRRSLLILSAVLAMASCRPDSVQERYSALPGEEWDRFDAVTFGFQIPDPGLYRISLCLRHTTAYDMTNLWCLLSTRSTLTDEFKDTVDIRLTDGSGRWKGKGGNLKALIQECGKNPVFLPAGTVTFHVRHGMPFRTIQGIRDIGIRLERYSPATEIKQENTDNDTHEEQTGKICGDGSTPQCLPAQTRGNIQD